MCQFKIFWKDVSISIQKKNLKLIFENAKTDVSLVTLRAKEGQQSCKEQSTDIRITMTVFLDQQRGRAREVGRRVRGRHQEVSYSKVILIRLPLFIDISV